MIASSKIKEIKKSCLYFYVYSGSVEQSEKPTATLAFKPES